MSKAKPRLRLTPLTLAQANAAVAKLHRHHKPAVGHRFSIGALDVANARRVRLCGACIIGRPVARVLDQDQVAEVSRLVTDGTRNACSILYAAAARACAAMGYARVQTYILASEPGTSLKAAGWTDEGSAGGVSWKREGGRDGRGSVAEMKRRWAKDLAPPVSRPEF